MGQKNKWNNIASMDGLEADWEYTPHIFSEKRAFVRIKDQDIAELLKVREIFVKIITAKQTYIGHLLDISEGGLLLDMAVSLEENLPVQVGFFLGTVKIISKAVIRRTHKIGELYTTGIKFVELNDEFAEYIRGMYASKVLRQAG